MSKPHKNPSCPCGNADYTTCCGRFIEQAQLPPSAALLMRSRYSAFVLHDEVYLQASWHPSTRPQDAIIDRESAPKWLGLEIRHSQESGEQATVEFVARYKIDGHAHRLHEISRFLREEVDGQARWFYLDGSFPESTKQ
ncbi:MAG: YchJ family metal-binding protein [Pseudomonadota bacterium]